PPETPDHRPHGSALSDADGGGVAAPTLEPDAHNPSGRTFLGQPGPLANLFSVELWERFSFYGMQGVLAIYMYFAAVDGGLGAERTLFGSAVMIMLGHIALALVPGIPGLMAGLLLVGVGSGGLKSTAATLVGSLYSRDDPRRDAGFSIYYMGINIGGLLGPL